LYRCEALTRTDVDRDEYVLATEAHWEHPACDEVFARAEKSLEKLGVERLPVSSPQRHGPVLRGRVGERLLEGTVEGFRHRGRPTHTPGIKRHARALHAGPSRVPPGGVEHASGKDV